MTVSHLLPRVLWRKDPVADPLPLMFDSPHSGTDIPDDFEFVCAPRLIKGGADFYVDELYAAAPHHGATLLAALFPRAYIDTNRHEIDIDPSMLDAPWPGEVREGRKEVWNGLVRSRTRGGKTFYDRKLQVAEIQHRIENYYRPYHAELENSLDALCDQFGGVWHVNCHACSRTNHWNGRPNADFILGDRFGKTSEPEFIAFLADTIAGLGHSVSINKPYAGQSLITRYSAPERQRHSVQIEISSDCYHAKKSIEKGEQFTAFQENISALIAATGEYVRAKLKTR